LWYPTVGIRMPEVKLIFLLAVKPRDRRVDSKFCSLKPTLKALACVSTNASIEVLLISIDNDGVIFQLSRLN
jgi:hypothetical protein